MRPPFLRLRDALTVFLVGGAVCASALAAHAATAEDWRVLDPAGAIAAEAIDPSFVIATPAAPVETGVAPFILSGASSDRQRAEDCLTSAIYYEAATESRAGQEAVAQVVLNRVRHPLYPKSVCGVVYEGVGAGVHCQFTFACDGSLARRPALVPWDNARKVAEAALAGHVAGAVGASTHYHAYYVSPAWRLAMVRTERIGAHIFYRLPGTRGTPAALNGRYAEAEPTPPPVVLAKTGGNTTSAIRGRHSAAVGEPRTVDFTVWGIKMATISVKRGQIDVKSAS